MKLTVFSACLSLAAASTPFAGRHAGPRLSDRPIGARQSTFPIHTFDQTVSQQLAHALSTKRVCLINNR